MPPSIPVSVFIICKDEADRIHYPIESVKGWVDEIIVVDSGSTDGTMDRARALGADQVLFRAWEGYGPQKVYAEGLCRNNWVLNLDADEQVSEELQMKIRSLFMDGREPENALYAIKNTMVFPFEKEPRRFSPSGYFVRLYRKDSAGFKTSTVHDSVIARIDGLSVKRIHQEVYHYSFRDFHHMIEKMNRYTDMQADDMVTRGRRIPGWRIYIEPLSAFLKAYFLRRYILFGAEGIAHSVFYSFFRTMRLAKVRERLKR